MEKVTAQLQAQADAIMAQGLAYYNRFQAGEFGDPVIVGIAAVFATFLFWKLFLASDGKRYRHADLPYKTNRKYKENEYDIVVVGLSVSGCAVAKRFSDQGRRVLIIERDMATPDRIVGELMQPGGMECLSLFGMEDCARSIGSTCTGYVCFAEGQEIILPYAKGYTGCSFHFGDFVDNIRKFVIKNCKQNVTIVQGTAVDLEHDETGRVIGVKYRPGVTGATAASSNGTAEAEGEEIVSAKVSSARSATPTRKSGSRSAKASAAAEDHDGSSNGYNLAETVTATGALVVMCDGSGSNFRRKVNTNGKQNYNPHSHFVGLVVKGITLPYETKGHVFLCEKGPALAYRLDPGEVRFLVDYKGPALPCNKIPNKDTVQKWLREDIAPELPDSMRKAFLKATDDLANIRSMPTPFFTQLFPKYKGLCGVGDHHNQRHPVTGGGMTCAYRDTIALSEELSFIPDLLDDPKAVQRAIDTYTCVRCKSVGCINILSWALYAVFEGPAAMRRACFRYFFLGGEAVAGPMSMLSGIRSSVPFLLYHYYRVMFYGTYLIMTHDHNKTLASNEPIPLRFFYFLTFFMSPWRIWTTIHLLAYSTRVFIPLLFREFLPSGRFFHP